MLADAPTGLTPLCVDIEGTLILSDMLLESLLLLIKRNPLYLLRVPLWLMGGKAVLKAEVAARIKLNPAGLPYNRELIDWLRSEHLTGRSAWLCAAADEGCAENIAVHLGFFEGVIATAGSNNLAGESEATRLVERFGERGFDYCGDERRDLAIWHRANGAIIIRGRASLHRNVANNASLLRIFPFQVNPLRALVRALRPHQWAKNALVLVPMFAAHIARDPRALAKGLLAVVAFCLCASSVYVISDLPDLQADRAHSRKSGRPFAAGDLSILEGLAIAPILLIGAILIAGFLPGKFQLVFATYYALTLGYSFGLKGHVFIEALALAGLYTLRIIAGAAAVGVPLSFRLLLFSIFLFLSLALVKRFAELDALRRQHRLRAEGRGYHVEDLPLLQSLGTASGYLSVLVLALYINSPEIQSLYHHPKLVWMLCVLVLYWVSRVWIKAQRGTMHDDLVVFALKDPTSLVIGLTAIVTVAAAI